jgi:predicted ATPase/class 3 adenylate cyclase
MYDEPRERRDLPTGTVTFLRTDVEGSMSIARTLGEGWDALSATHADFIRGAIADHGGTVVRTEGDGIFAVFTDAGAAVTAAIEAQRRIGDHSWPEERPIRVRMGLHAGEVRRAGEDYGGFEVNRAARIADTGHGGQIVLSEPVRALVADALPDGILIRDLGAHVLRDVPRAERLYQLDVPGLRSEFPPLRTATAPPGNVPLPLTSFVGRERELVELDDLLERHRLLTITGPGGIGKTRVAIELARRRLGNWLDGTWFVALDEIEDPGLVGSAIARTMGLFDGPERPAADALLPYLAGRSALLVLDNFEHVMSATGDVGAILRASPDTRVVVTSRSPLRIAGEQEYPVRPLETAASGATESVELFVERARRVRPAFELGTDAAVVAEICELLDGLPLGIELAAARTSLLPLAAIRERLGARLPLPGPGLRDVPDRQRTLEGAISWSYALLSPERQRLLRDLAVFEGGFALEQVSAIQGGADVLDGLLELVDQSLLMREPGDEIRFRLLRTIGTFALGELEAEGREPDLRRRHALAYLALAESAAPHLPGGDQPRWLDRLEADHANLRAALRWSIEAGDVDVAFRLVAGLWRYWQLGGHLAEGARLADAAMALPGADRRTPQRLTAVTAVGGIAYWQGRAEEAVRWYEEQLALARELDDKAAEADAAFNLSYGAFIRGDVPRSNELMDRARDLYGEVGDARGAARTEWTRATAVMSEGQTGDALLIFEAAADRFAELGDVWYHAMAIGSVAWARFALGDMVGASHKFVESLVAYHALRDVATTAISLQIGAIVALEAGRPEDAAVLTGAMEALGERYGVKPPAGLAWLIKSRAPSERVEASLEPDVLTAALERGRRLSLDEAVELVLRIESGLPGDGSATPNA